MGQCWSRLSDLGIRVAFLSNGLFGRHGNCEMVIIADSRWLLAPSDLKLSHDEVHVWCARLTATDRCIRDLWGTLARDEVWRAERYRFTEDRDRFVVARSLLRCILGRYLAMAPEEVEIQYGPFGRPILPKVAGRTGLQFSVSHSSGMVLYAMARERQVGIDLERIRALPDVRALVEGCFSPTERAAFCALPSEQQLLAFFRCWTRKEAFIKAKGQGLSFALDRFEVSMAPGEAARLLHVDGDPREASRWSLRELSPGHDYVAALAVEGRGLRLSYWRWAA